MTFRMRMRMWVLVAAWILGLPGGSGVLAGDIGNWTFNTSLRSRVEHWDWFDTATAGREDSYTYLGNLFKLKAARKTTKRDYAFELAVPWLAGLPTAAVAPGAQGQLGVGGTYRAVNGGQEVSAVIRQAHVTFRGFDDEHLKLRLGRFEFVDGAESFTGDPTLDWLKKARISHRLVGTFGWTHVQRSFDGLQITRETESDHWLANVLAPTAGAFDLDANQQLEDIHLAYFGHTWKGGPDRGDTRLFALLYDDDRRVLKTDNRPIAVRRADPGDVTIQSFGGHHIRKAGPFDLLAWGVVQTGDWGGLDHEAWAFAGEVGWQPEGTRGRPWGRPWLRAGYNATSGDRDPADGKHETFFQVLPTARQYARFPFFNMMNVRDLFAQLILRPHARLSIRADWHRLDLDESADLWYLGGGAFQDATFGFVGRPSGGFDDLARFLDVSIDYKLGASTQLSLYGSHATGRNVIRSIYPGTGASLTYLEATHKF